MRSKKPEHPAVVIFRKRARSIYAGMKRRAAAIPYKMSFNYALFEVWLVEQFDGDKNGVQRCFYSGAPLTAENFFVDHDWPISRGGSFDLRNLRLCTNKENLCKGNMTGEEWIRLRNYINAMDPVPRESIMRRLAVGDVQRFAHFRRQRKGEVS